MSNFSQKYSLWLCVRSLKTAVCNGNCDRRLIIMMLVDVDIINVLSWFIKQHNEA